MKAQNYMNKFYTPPMYFKEQYPLKGINIKKEYELIQKGISKLTARKRRMVVYEQNKAKLER